MEVKRLNQYTKSIADRTVTGIFSVSGNMDDYHDIVQAGSFAKTIKERGTAILHLWQHDMESPATAVIKSLREVGRAELPDDAKSAYPEATGGAEVVREYLDTPRANEVLANIKAGVPLQMSYSYDAVKSTFEQRDGIRVRLLSEQKLYETSDCTFGANDATAASKSRPPSASKLRGALKSLKAMGDMDIWSECYDIYGASSALSSVAMLLDGESDDPAQMAQLIGCLRLLLAFIGGEIDGIETMGTDTSGMQSASLDGIARQLKTYQQLMNKTGARNASADQTMVDTIHQLAYNLGASNCLGIPDTTSGDKSRADAPTGVPLTQLKAQLAYLDFAIKE